MKKTLVILMLTIVATMSFSQSKTSNHTELESKIIEVDKAGWEAWKNKDAKWFSENLTEDFIMVTSGGTSNKEQVVKSTPDCEVKSYSLGEIKVTMLNDNAALLTYTVNQDAVCSGEKIHAEVRASACYVNKGGKWLEAFYMETAIAK